MIVELRAIGKLSNTTFKDNVKAYQMNTFFSQRPAMTFVMPTVETGKL